VIVVRDLCKSFGTRTVLEDISFEVSEREVLAIMGSSGGGKTTLLRCIAGLIPMNSGSVEVDGIDVGARPEEARHRMGMVFQSAALFDYLSVRGNVLFGAKRQRRIPAAEQDGLVKELLDAVGISQAEHLLPSELSGGMKKRVGIARALAMRPSVLLYDEPITGLDPITAYLIDQVILRVRERFGVTSIVVSHDVSSVVRIAQRIAFLDEGRLAFLGTPSEFLASAYPAIAELIEKSEAKVLN
jgi:phospholipid/cholesterol/gamma-HCH transport system ATP-binding protein